MDLLHDASLEFLGDLDAATGSLDLLGEVAQTCDLQSSSLYSDLAQGQIGAPSCENDVTIDAEPSDQARSRRQTQAEKNRRYQKTFRRNQQAKMQRLQEDLAASAALVERLQADNHRLKTGPSAASPSHEATQQNMPQCSQSEFAPLRQITTRLSVANSIYYNTWAVTSTNKLTCTVHHLEEVISMCHVLGMAPQQTMILWQDYIREFAVCLAKGGPALQDDLSSEAGRRLTELVAEFRRLLATQGAADLKKYADFAKRNSFLDTAHHPTYGSSGAESQNWLEHGHALRLTDTQKSWVFCLRRIFLQRDAILRRHRRSLQLELEGLTAGHADSSTVDQISQQLMDMDMDILETYWAYRGVIYDGVFTIWQGVMCTVRLFPNPPQLFTCTIDALAEEAGEFSAREAYAMAGNIDNIEEASASLFSMQTQIYSARLSDQKVHTQLVT